MTSRPTNAPAAGALASQGHTGEGADSALERLVQLREAADLEQRPNAPDSPDARDHPDPD